MYNLSCNSSCRILTRYIKLLSTIPVLWKSIWEIIKKKYNSYQNILCNKIHVTQKRVDRLFFLGFFFVSIRGFPTFYISLWHLYIEILTHCAQILFMHQSVIFTSSIKQNCNLVYSAIMLSNFLQVKTSRTVPSSKLLLMILF